MRKQPHFHFCFPYRGAGGVSMLFLRLGEYLAETHGVRVTLIDYEDGYMARHITSKAVTLLVYRDGESCHVPADGTLVLQSMNPWSIFPDLRVEPAARLIFWNCLPFNLVPALPGLRHLSYRHPFLLKFVLRTVLSGRRKRNAGLVKAMYEKKALLFQDDENVAVTQSALGVPLPDPVFMPIPGPANSAPPPPRPVRGPGEPLRVVWVGRLADFKYLMLIRVLRDLDAISGRPVLAKIVGGGDFESEVRACVSGLEQVHAELVGEVPPPALESFLTSEADIFVGMGTAALEASRLGIPTILLDVSYGVVSSSYRYRWLHEEKGYAIGRVLAGERSYPPGRSLDQLLAEFDDSAASISTSEYAYYQANHSLPAVAAKFLANAEHAQYLWGDLESSGANRRDFIYRLFVGLRAMARGEDT